MFRMPISAILSAFNTAFTEEQAWALCHSLCYHLRIGEHRKFSGPSQIYINSDGTVKTDGHKEDTFATESELIECLGIALFQTLDYGFKDNEEHELSVCLEELIESMTSQSILSNEDEGFLNDSFLTFQTIIKTCEERLLTLTTSKEATSPREHYPAVCRAIITEANELLSFIETISTDRSVCSLENKDKNKEEWARIWMQTMRELRFGEVTLRKLTPAQLLQPQTYELTPYEALMRDIASKAYTLNKVENFIGPVMKDAHDLILDFIRSRPPLLPAQDRVLARLPTPEPELREQILAQIRNVRTKTLYFNANSSIPKLKPTSELKRINNEHSLSENKKKIKKIIHADSLKFDFDSSLDSDDNSETFESSLHFHDDDVEDEVPTYLEASDTDGIVEQDIVTSSDYRRILLESNALLDERDGMQSLSLGGATVDETAEQSRVIVAPPSPMSPLSPLSPFSPTNDFITSFSFSSNSSIEMISPSEVPPISDRQTSDVHVRPHSPQLNMESIATLKKVPREDIRPSIVNESMNLTLMELKHIRHVLTKVELEQLLFDIQLFKEVKNGKVCFACRKIQFSLFKWRYKCSICSRFVCFKCIRKVHIPSGNLDGIPLSVLTPTTIQCDFFMFQEDDKGERKTLKSSTPRRLVCMDCKQLIKSIIFDSKLCLKQCNPSPENKASRNFHLDLKVGQSSDGLS